jgi:hypothetical protein
VLTAVDSIEALLYCDTELPAHAVEEEKKLTVYNCIYNGKPINIAGPPKKARLLHKNSYPLLEGEAKSGVVYRTKSGGTVQF